MIRDAEATDPTAPLCSKTHLYHGFNTGRAKRTQKLLVIYVFLGITCVGDFLVSVIINYDS